MAIRTLSKPQSVTPQETSQKPKANYAAGKIIGLAYEDLERIVKTIDGLDTFCSYVNEDGEEKDLADGIGILMQFIKRDLLQMREKFGQIEISQTYGE